MTFLSIEEALADLRDGKMIVLVDDRKLESEGAVMMAAEKVSAQNINFMALHARGIVCLPMAHEMITALALQPMTKGRIADWQGAYTVSIEARHGVTTGISAADRATTIQAAVADGAKPYDLVRPGHIFPIGARKGGVMQRVGATEAAVDLTRLAGLKPAGVICKILDEAGEMARGESLRQFSTTHGCSLCAIADLIAYRMRTESFVHRVSEAQMPSRFGGVYQMVVYENDMDDFQHIALIKGTIDPDQPVLVRVHTECFTGDILGSMRCDCGTQLQNALKVKEKDGTGVLLYVRQEGRGIGLINKLKAYNLQDRGLDTVEANQELGFQADLRDYGVGAQVLVDLGVRKMRLITNNPKKIVGLEGYGLSVVEQVPIEVPPNEYNRCYLECKKLKMGHLLHLEEAP